MSERDLEQKFAAYLQFAVTCTEQRVETKHGTVNNSQERNLGYIVIHPRLG